jgi:hypothetical protein
MSLIPGSLPSDTCFGTPQELLELFAQYLDIPAFAVSSKVLYSSTSPMPNTDYVWVDTTGTDTPVLKLYNEIIGDYDSYPFSGQTSPTGNEKLIAPKNAASTLTGSELVLVSQNSILKRTTAQLVANLAPVPATGAINYSQLNNNTANDSTGVNLNVKRRTAFAWVAFNGWYGYTSGTATAAGIYSSFNIGTVTWTTGTNLYQLTFTVAAPDANYCVQTSSSGLVNSAGDLVASSVTAVTPVFTSGGTNLNSTAGFAVRVFSGTTDYRDRFVYATVYAAV